MVKNIIHLLIIGIISIGMFGCISGVQQQQAVSGIGSITVGVSGGDVIRDDILDLSTAVLTVDGQINKINTKLDIKTGNSKIDVTVFSKDGKRKFNGTKTITINSQENMNVTIVVAEAESKAWIGIFDVQAGIHFKFKYDSTSWDGNESTSDFVVTETPGIVEKQSDGRWKFIFRGYAKEEVHLVGAFSDAFWNPSDKRYALTLQKYSPTDMTAPVITYAKISGTAPDIIEAGFSKYVTVLNSEGLSATINGTEVGITGIEIEDGIIGRVALAKEVPEGAIVKLSYNDLSGNVIDMWGNKLCGISNKNVWNEIDYTAPALISAEVANNNPFDVVLTFSEKMTGTHSGFTVKINENIADISEYNILDTKITLKLLAPVTAGQSVTVSHDALIGDEADMSDTPNYLASFNNQIVTNRVADSTKAWKFILNPAAYGVTITDEVHLVGDLPGAKWEPADKTYSLTKQADGTWTGIFDISEGNMFVFMYDGASWANYVGTNGTGGAPFQVGEGVYGGTTITRNY